MNMLLDSKVLDTIRLSLILQCYGEKAVEDDLSFTLCSGEVINAWVIENLSKEELTKKYTNEEIIFIYYNAL